MVISLENKIFAPRCLTGYHYDTGIQLYSKLAIIP